MRVTAVVLAGGESRRFGSDKLAAVVDHLTVLDHTLAGLPAEWAVVVVGPERVAARPVTFTREQPPGGGPAVALVTGLRAALATEQDAIVVLPGDAPAAGRAAPSLLAGLNSNDATVGVDAAGRVQPLQLALRPAAARRLVELAGPDGAAGRSARRLVARVDPQPVGMPPDHAYDIDTLDQLLVWRLHTAPAVSAVVEAIAGRRTAVVDRAFVVAIDGPSGAGKSTLAAAVALRTGGSVLDGDDFYNPVLPGLGPAARAVASDAEAAGLVIDWRRLRREALQPLRQGRAAIYRPYDWHADDGRLSEPKTVAAGELVVVEGVYSARPELADLVDVTVYVEIAPDLRAARLAERAEDRDWAAFWDRGEQHYFTAVRPPAAFDLRLAP